MFRTYKKFSRNSLHLLSHQKVFKNIPLAITHFNNNMQKTMLWCCVLRTTFNDVSVFVTSLSVFMKNSTKTCIHTSTISPWLLFSNLRLKKRAEMQQCTLSGHSAHTTATFWNSGSEIKSYPSCLIIAKVLINLTLFTEHVLLCYIQDVRTTNCKLYTRRSYKYVHTTLADYTSISNHKSKPGY